METNIRDNLKIIYAVIKMDFIFTAIQKITTKVVGSTIN
jgi:hypothetical protein